MVVEYSVTVQGTVPRRVASVFLKAIDPETERECLCVNTVFSRNQ